MAAKVKKCRRCGRRLRRATYVDAMAWLNNGSIDHVVCGPCQTPTEHAEMAIREATMEAGVNTHGKILVRPKVRQRDQEELRAVSGDAHH